MSKPKNLYKWIKTISIRQKVDQVKFLKIIVQMLSA